MERTALTSEMMIEPMSAGINPSTVKPSCCGNRPTMSSMTALMTNMNKPSVAQVSGIEMSTRIGFTNPFRMPSTTAVNSSESYFPASPSP